MITDDSYLFENILIQYLKFHDKDDCLMIGDFLNWTKFLNRELTYYWVARGKWIYLYKKCIITQLELIKKYNINYQNEDVQLH